MTRARGWHLPVHFRSVPHFVDDIKVQPLKLALLLARLPPPLAADPDLICSGPASPGLLARRSKALEEHSARGQPRLAY